MGKRTQMKLAGKLGVCPVHISDAKFGRRHLGGKAARRAAKLLKTEVDIWIEGASEADIRKRLVAVDEYLGR